MGRFLTCLQLYCDCFNTGRLCSVQCKCSNCFNNAAHAEERAAAAACILQRNPTTFSPNIEARGDNTASALARAVEQP
jgi:hypothetical protein